MTVGARVKELRTKKGISQQELSRRVNRASSYISRIERDMVNVSDGVLMEICVALGADFTWLKTGEGRMFTGKEPEMDTQHIGERIRQLRKENGLLQKDFADRIGATKETISVVEKGKRIPTDRWLQKVADEFGVSMQWLLTGVEDGQQVVERNIKRIGDYLRYNETARIAIMEAINSDDDGIWVRIEQLIRERQQEG